MRVIMFLSYNRTYLMYSVKYLSYSRLGKHELLTKSAKIAFYHCMTKYPKIVPKFGPDLFVWFEGKTIQQPEF